VQAREGRFLLATWRQGPGVGFWYVPPSLRERLRLHVMEPADGPADITGVPEALREELGTVAPALAGRMRGAGDAVVGVHRSKGLPNFFKCAFAGGKGLSAGDVEALLDRMDALGQDL